MVCGVGNAQKTFVTPRNINELIHRALGVRAQVATSYLDLLQHETSCGRAREPQVGQRMNEATQSTLLSFADGAQVGVSASESRSSRVILCTKGWTRSQSPYSRHNFRPRPDVR